MLLNRKQIKAFKNGEKTIEEIALELSNTLPSLIIATEYVETILADNTEIANNAVAPVVLSQEDYDKVLAMFSVKVKSNRGRKPKNTQ